jgi:hypothetical protein
MSKLPDMDYAPLPNDSIIVPLPEWNEWEIGYLFKVVREAGGSHPLQIRPGEGVAMNPETFEIYKKAFLARALKMGESSHLSTETIRKWGKQ